MFIVALSISSCDNYLDVNKDQTNNPFSSQLLPSNKLAGAISGFQINEIFSLHNFGDKMSYTYTINNGFTTSDAAYFYNNFTSSSYSSIWDNLYLSIDNFQDILDDETTRPEYAYHYAVAKTFKVMGMDHIISLYGDAPYSEAFKGLDNSYPKYDDDKEIYKDLIAQLESARDNINNAPTDVVDLGSEDIVFGGDTAQWLKFINTLELKLILRSSNSTDAQIITVRNQALANLPQDFISSDVAVNPGYNRSTITQYSPLYRLFGLNESLTGYTSSRNANGAGSYIQKVLLGTMNNSYVNSTGVVDPRRPRKFNGTSYSNQGEYPTSGISRLAGFVSGVSGATLADAAENGASRGSYLMLASESYFLQAEALERGYLAGGSSAAKTAFEQGITSSFEFNSVSFGNVTVSPLNAAPYILATANKNGLGWNSADKINAIMTQKWLAISQWTGIEPYLDHLRTGFPYLPLPTGTTQTHRPYRLIYPNSEYSSNAGNVPAMTQNDIFTINSLTPFYYQ